MAGRRGWEGADVLVMTDPSLETTSTWVRNQATGLQRLLGRCDICLVWQGRIHVREHATYSSVAESWVPSIGPKTCGLPRRMGHRVVASMWLGQCCQGSH